jgi:hypothetical protein
MIRAEFLSPGQIFWELNDKSWQVEIHVRFKVFEQLVKLYDFAFLKYSIQNRIFMQLTQMQFYCLLVVYSKISILKTARSRFTQPY